MGSKVRFAWTAPPGFGARRLWFAITALSAYPVLKKLWSNFNDAKPKDEDPITLDSKSPDFSPEESTSFVGKEEVVVTHEDLENLCHLLEIKDGGPAWQEIMNRSTPKMTYQAWRYEPEIGPTAYCSRTVIDDAFWEEVTCVPFGGEFTPGVWYIWQDWSNANRPETKEQKYLKRELLMAQDQIIEKEMVQM